MGEILREMSPKELRAKLDKVTQERDALRKRVRELEGTIGLERIAAHKVNALIEDAKELAEAVETHTKNGWFQEGSVQKDMISHAELRLLATRIFKPLEDWKFPDPGGKAVEPKIKEG